MMLHFGEPAAPAQVPAASRRAEPVSDDSPVQRLQDRANAGPHARGLSAIGALLNPAPAAPPPAPVQRMRWRKRGDDIIPEDPDYRGAPNDRDGIYIPHHNLWNDGDIWDDQTGNVYHGATGLLRFNDRAAIGDDELVPEKLRGDIAALNSDPDLSTKRKLESYRLKLNQLTGAIRAWMASIEDPVERYEGGYEEAGNRALARLDALRQNTLYPQAVIDPKQAASITLAEASERLYTDVQGAALTQSGTRNVDTIDSSSPTPNDVTGQTTIDTHDLTPQGEGLRWWASAAMGLRTAGATANRGALLHLQVGTGRVPIGVRSNDQYAGGEYIVLGHNAPIAHDTAPDQLGLRTPGNAGGEHRVSYPAFRERLAALKLAHGGTDPEIARAMLAMVRNPAADPGGVAPELLPAMRELLVTWMVAEPARHRSVIFNGVLSLREVAAGTSTFDQMLADNGQHPMTGPGTAAHGRTAEGREGQLREGVDVGDMLSSSPVVRRQREQLERVGGNSLSAPLEEVLRGHGIGGNRLRPVAK